MADDSSHHTLDDYFTLQRGTTYKSRLLGHPGPILLGLATIQRNGGFRTDSLRTYGGDSPSKLLVQPGELYLSLKDVTQSADLLGAVARLPFDQPPGRLTQDTVKLVPKGQDVPVDYLYWLLRTPQYRAYCRAHATGTTNLGLPRDDFLAFPAPEPTPSRHRIVELLTALDDKIELNRRMNETLEEMARAIFKSWFVDFDPVRAKAEGRETGLPEHIADLFPDRFEDSELGEIPAGWKTAALSEVMEVNPRRSLKKGEIAPYLDMKNMPTQSARAVHVYDREFGSGVRFVDNDTLVARITPCLENGKTCFVDFLEEGNIGWGSTEYIVLRPKPQLPAEFAYFLARTEMFRTYAISNMSGTSGRQRVPAASLDQFIFAVPPAEVAGAFGKTAHKIMKTMKAKDKESRTLAAIRDALLPRLISGELRVGEAERVVGGHV